MVAPIFQNQPQNNMFIYLPIFLSISLSLFSSLFTKTLNNGGKLWLNFFNFKPVRIDFCSWNDIKRRRRRKFDNFRGQSYGVGVKSLTEQCDIGDEDSIDFRKLSTYYFSFHLAYLILFGLYIIFEYFVQNRAINFHLILLNLMSVIKAIGNEF